MLNLRITWQRIALAISLLLGLILTPGYAAARPQPAAVLDPRPLEDHIIVSILSPLPKTVCLGQKLKIEFGVMLFGGTPSPMPLTELVPIVVRAQAKLGKVSPEKMTIAGVTRWESKVRTLTYIAPRKAGQDLVTIAAFFGSSDAHAQDLTFEVKPCKYRAAIQATEKDISSATQNEMWKIIMNFNAIGEFAQEEDSDSLKGEGTVNLWLDGIYMGPKNAFSCDVTQMLSGNGTFQIGGQAQEGLSIDTTFDPMALSAFTVACKGPGASGSGGTQPTTGPGFAFKVTVPAEGGTQEYVYGTLTLHINVFRES